MDNWMVFNSDDMPGRMLSVHYMINNDVRHHDIGFVISEEKRNLAMNIAQKILEGDVFFHIQEIPTEQFIEISGSCVVLTTEEWRKAMQDQFKRGRECGIGMMPSNVTIDTPKPRNYTLTERNLL